MPLLCQLLPFLFPRLLATQQFVQGSSDLRKILDEPSIVTCRNNKFSYITDILRDWPVFNPTDLTRSPLLQQIPRVRSSRLLSERIYISLVKILRTEVSTSSALASGGPAAPENHELESSYHLKKQILPSHAPLNQSLERTWGIT